MKIKLLFFMFLVMSVCYSQEFPSNYQTKKVVVTDTIQIDSISINPLRFQVIENSGSLVDSLNYEVDFSKSILIIKDTTIINSDSLTLRYLRYPDYLTRDYFVLDTSIIVNSSSAINKLYSLRESTSKDKFKPFDGLNTLGSISRGVTVGNNQNAVVNSELNLQITGKLSDKIAIRASIQDANIPTQEGGYTQSLDEFDQIFIELFSDNWNIRAGDIDLINNRSYFGNFTKKVQGISLGGTLQHNNTAKTEVFAAAALVRGVFSRSQFVGQEGNQGPYKLVGPNGELYILIVSGSERVYVNGLLLERGVDKDYIIDYNAGEVKFNPTYPITANMRISIEYQYTDRNYTRFIGFGGGNYSSDQLDIGAYIYSESDAKNQPLQQNLSQQQVEILKNAGDDTSRMIAPSSIPDTYSENKILYKKELIDGIEAFVFSSNPEDELFNVRFSLVGEGQGNYVLSNESTISNIFEYVAPINGILQGSYEPIIQLTAPEKLQIGGVNIAFHPNKKTNVFFEVAGSKNDLNLFSQIDNKDNNGFAGRLNGRQTILNKGDQRKLDAFISIDFINEDFRSVERIYDIEFSRNWNIENPIGDQQFIIGGFDFSDKKIGAIKYEFQNLEYSKSYQGYRHVLGTNLLFGKFNFFSKGSTLKSNDKQTKTDFNRLNTIATYSFNKAWVGAKANFEDNQIRTIINDSLNPTSQRYEAYEAFTGLGDSTKIYAEIGYRYRINDSVRSSKLQKVSTSQDVFLKSRVLNTSNSKLSLFVNYRNLINEESEEENETSINSRLLYNQSLLKGGVRITTALESNSGVLPQQEYTYVQVAPGEGIYTWIDYNENSVQELEEFEIAQFQDEAEYVRVLLPNQVFVKIRETKYSQTLTLNPQQWSNQNGVKNILSHFYNQTSFLIDKKVMREDGVFFINPFKKAGEDELAQNSNFRNALFYNRSKQKFTTSYTYLSSTNRNLLSVGLVQNKLKSHQLNFNHKIWTHWILNLKGSIGENESITENFESRNYTLDTYEYHPKIAYLVNPQTRLELFYNFLNKENQLGENEQLDQHKIGVALSYSNFQKISINGEFNYIENSFKGNAFSPVGYQILEGLQPGNNLTWNMLIQKKITKFLDLNLTYFGRKSETSKAIHSGSVQLRAYF